MTMLGSSVQAVLFDLDGTLIDSAPDLVGAVNWLRVQRGLPPLPYAQLRCMVGAGARGMVGAAFGLVPGDPGFDELRDAFLARYEEAMLVDTRIFADIPPLLQALVDQGIPWGIVTNKASRFAIPVVQGLGLDQQATVLICGDTTAHAKPHPEPLLEAARRLNVSPEACIYLGDDLRDVQAGRSAGMSTVAVRWGYLGAGEAIESWGADLIIDSPDQLLKSLDLA
jgi:2-phosphoglycolate phosphatase